MWYSCACFHEDNECKLCRRRGVIQFLKVPQEYHSSSTGKIWSTPVALITSPSGEPIQTRSCQFPHSIIVVINNINVYFFCMVGEFYCLLQRMQPQISKSYSETSWGCQVVLVMNWGVSFLLLNPPSTPGLLSFLAQFYSPLCSQSIIINLSHRFLTPLVRLGFKQGDGIGNESYK